MSSCRETNAKSIGAAFDLGREDGAKERTAVATGFALGAKAMRDMLMGAPSLRGVRGAIGRVVTDEWIESATAEALRGAEDDIERARRGA